MFAKSLKGAVIIQLNFIKPISKNFPVGTYAFTVAPNSSSREIIIFLLVLSTGTADYISFYLRS